MLLSSCIWLPLQYSCINPSGILSFCILLLEQSSTSNDFGNWPIFVIWLS